MLPSFREDGWLPVGHHPATWEEIVQTFGGEPGSRRAQILSGLLRWRDALRSKGMAGTLILDGSFISRKPDPGDFDCYFVYDGVTATLIGRDAEASALTEYRHCKEHYGGDVLVFSAEALRQFPEFCRTDGFDLDKVTRQPKGVLEVIV